MKKLLTLCFILLWNVTSHAQTNKELALQKGEEAVKLMDQGNIDESMKLLKEAEKLDPKNMSYPYEIGYAYYISNDYKNCAKTMTGLLKHKDVDDKVYQLLGNSYDMMGDPGKAIQTYKDGLKKFPGSGRLYLEMGVMNLAKEDYNAAVGFFEQGIHADPSFSSNYYWASRLYLGSSEKVWGMIYGEIFMNLERNSKRTVEMSKMLYNTYVSSISFESDTVVKANFSENNMITINGKKDLNNFKLPFGMIYDTDISIAAIMKKEINLDNLSDIREGMISFYFQAGQDKDYPNALFDYQKKIIDLGYSEAYNHWLLMKGAPDEFDEWYDANEEKYNAFIEWYTENPIQLSKKNYFHRENY